MADEAPAAAKPDAHEPAKPAARGRRTKAQPASEPAPAKAPAAEKKDAGPKAPRRPTLDPEESRLLRVRKMLEATRPKFVRTASNRYWRIGRWESWRTPRGLQSKQRRHYGYRPRVVRIGYGGPKATRGLSPTGFKPVLVRTPKDLEGLDATHEAVLIARTVGTKRRLVLEESCRKLGLHILNPIVREEAET